MLKKAPESREHRKMRKVLYPLARVLDAIIYISEGVIYKIEKATSSRRKKNYKNRRP